MKKVLLLGTRKWSIRLFKKKKWNCPVCLSIWGRYVGYRMGYLIIQPWLANGKKTKQQHQPNTCLQWCLSCHRLLSAIFFNCDNFYFYLKCRPAITEVDELLQKHIFNFYQVTFMVISVTWCVLRRFCGDWDLSLHRLVSCSLGTMSTEERMEWRYVFKTKFA